MHSILDTLALPSIPGLEDVLAGRFTPNRLHLLQGPPGFEKTTLVIQLLMQGVHRNEPALYA